MNDYYEGIVLNSGEIKAVDALQMRSGRSNKRAEL
jgi:hypothetical protein